MAETLRRPVVLAVGDELAARLTRAALHAAGYEVEAVTRSSMPDARARVVVTDEPAVIAATREAQPSARILLLGKERGDADECLPCPFAPRELVRRVDRLYSETLGGRLTAAPVR